MEFLLPDVYSNVCWTCFQAASQISLEQVDSPVTHRLLLVHLHHDVLQLSFIITRLLPYPVAKIALKDALHIEATQHVSSHLHCKLVLTHLQKTLKLYILHINCSFINRFTLWTSSINPARKLSIGYHFFMHMDHFLRHISSITTSHWCGLPDIFYIRLPQLTTTHHVTWLGNNLPSLRGLHSGTRFGWACSSGPCTQWPWYQWEF